MNSNKKTARIAGLWYLLADIFGSFNMGYVYPMIYESGDATATVNKILASEWLFRVGFVSNLVCQICFLFLAHAYTSCSNQ